MFRGDKLGPLFYIMYLMIVAPEASFDATEPEVDLTPPVEFVAPDSMVKKVPLFGGQKFTRPFLGQNFDPSSWNMEFTIATHLDPMCLVCSKSGQRTHFV